MKKIAIMLLLAVIILSGCGYGSDVESQAFVVAVGIDKGKSFPLKLTFVFANPGSGGSEGESPSPPKPDTISVEAPTVFSAVRKLDSIKSKTINLSHTKIVVFSEKIAKSGIKNYLSGFASSRDFRPNTYVCVALGSARDYLESVKPSHETFIEKYYDNIMQKVAQNKVNEAYLYYLYFNTVEKYSGSLVPLAGVNKNTLRSSHESAAQHDDFSYEAIAGEIARDGHNPAEILGCAIFKNDKMIGTLGSFETDLARIIRNEYYPRNYSIAYPDSSEYVTIRIFQQQRPRIESSVQNGNAHFKISVPISIEYVDAGKIENDKKKSDQFCKYLQKTLSNKAKALIKKSQIDYNTDILNLGNRLKRHFTDVRSWESFDWENKYASSQIDISFDVMYADFEEAN